MKKFCLNPLAALAPFALISQLHCTSVLADNINFELGTSVQYFPNSPSATSQEDYHLDSNSYARIDWDKDFAEGKFRLLIDANAHYDRYDSNRRRADFSELALTYFQDDLDISAGVLTEFWGVTESRHLVDIINQTHIADNIDEETKLGQPMIKTQWHQGWGSLQFYWLPLFRERVYPSDSARLGPGDEIRYGHARYESSDRDHHQDFALRYSKTLDTWDIGLAHFNGTSREPLLLINPSQLPSISFTPYYEQIEQTSLDMQRTSDSLLLKLEAISRSSKLQGRYAAAVTGFEYTQVGIFNSAMDLGYLGEYLYDERGDKATTPFANDIFLGLRLVANNIAQTTYLLGAYCDADTRSRAWRFEMNTRLRDGLTLSIEAQAFTHQPTTDLLYGLRDDDYLTLGLQWYL